MRLFSRVWAVESAGGQIQHLKGAFCDNFQYNTIIKLVVSKRSPHKGNAACGDSTTYKNFKHVRDLVQASLQGAIALTPTHVVPQWTRFYPNLETCHGLCPANRWATKEEINKMKKQYLEGVITLSLQRYIGDAKYRQYCPKTSPRCIEGLFTKVGMCHFSSFFILRWVFLLHLLSGKIQISS